MKYEKTVHAKFIERLNRFEANVDIDGKEELVHVKNTGRCKELLLPGAVVVLSKANNPNRKTKYDLISVYKENLGWVNIDSQIPNRVVNDWLHENPKEFGNISLIKPEYTYGNSRIDFYIESDNKKILIEVKGCTLEIDGVGYFPDAPTERGVKHLKELTKAMSDGYECYIAFVIAMPRVRTVLPNISTHPEFGKALEEAKEAGVKVLNLICDVTPDSIKITECVKSS